nr:BlaI/MecI/CopY family transcriptional regulator [Chroococcidiopsis sp. CCMEE 29]
MTPLPDYRPKQLSLGPLEAEILNIVWELGSATVKDIHDRVEHRTLDEFYKYLEVSPEQVRGAIAALSMLTRMEEDNTYFGKPYLHDVSQSSTTPGQT